jgi:serine/threonine-protein kinase
MASNPTVAGRYDLLEVIGKGGMAVVWRALDNQDPKKRVVAVKRVLDELSADPGIKALFLEEARVGQTLHHPNIVETFDFGKDENRAYFLVLEWVDGLDLYEYMRGFHQAQVHVPWQVVTLIAHQALQGLIAAHERCDPSGRPQPVIHRDLTPSNVLIGVNGVVKLADFGLARAMDRATMTLPHMIKGKLSYTAPEMLRGQKANVRTDIYCLGLTLWECLAGKKLFAGTNQIKVLENVEQARVPRLEEFRPDVPRPLVAAIMKAVSRDPKDRYALARDMDASMSDLLQSVPEPLDPERLGRSVHNVRRRLQAPVPPTATVVIQDSADDAIEVSAELVVEYASSPSALRSVELEIIETTAQSTQGARATPPPFRKRLPPPPPSPKKPPPPPVARAKPPPHPSTKKPRVDGPKESTEKPAESPLGLGWPYGRVPRPSKPPPR